MSKIRKSAREETCQIRYPGCHTINAVWCHANGSAAGKGMGMKSDDELGSYGCQFCHDVYDRRRRAPEGYTRADVEVAFWEGHARSLRILKAKGLIEVRA